MATDLDPHTRIRQLEQELESLKRATATTVAATATATTAATSHNLRVITALLLLSDSALPIGSFAYSSGLESFLMHEKHSASATPSSGPGSVNLFQQKFLPLSIYSFTHTTVPYVLAAFRNPTADNLIQLDNDLDASTPCTVGRRASISQGRALLTLWSKAFALHNSHNSHQHNHNQQHHDQGQGQGQGQGNDKDVNAGQALDSFAHALKLASISPPTATNPLAPVNGHLPPLWGAICNALRLDIHETAYLFVFNHAKAVISAAVRASVMGPYMAQSILASPQLDTAIRRCLDRVWLLEPEEACQVVPPLDLWLGRHEILYSRIFNS